jgi:hypothetical protein
MFATDWPLSPADLPTLGIAQPDRRKEAKRWEREYPRLAESWEGSGQAPVLSLLAGAEAKTPKDLLSLKCRCRRSDGSKHRGRTAR